MSRKPQQNPAELEIRMTNPELWELRFIRTGDGSKATDRENVDAKLNLTIFRLERERIGVQISISLTELPDLDVEVAYRAAFELVGAAADDDIEEHLANVATQVAPVALYPYVREAVSNAFVRSGLKPFLLPIVNFRNILDPGSIVIPPPPDNFGAGDGELQAKPKQTRRRTTAKQ